MSEQSDPPGLDRAALTRWWREHLDTGDTALADADVVLSAELFAGGKSNLTYRIGDGARTWVLRRPPLGHVLATAHDMGREHRIMAALAPTDVPVPQMHAYVGDESVLGAPFFVMSHVDGTPYRWAEDLRGLGAERTRTISERLVDTLAALHEVDPASVGLAELGRPEGYLTRQVRRWGQQMERSQTRPLPAADELLARLQAGVAEAETHAGSGIVHGDYRLDNVLMDAADAPVAVLDWEMATLGDPLADVALFLLYCRLAEIAPSAVADASRAEGFLDADQLLARYAAARSTQSDDRITASFGFHTGLGAYKLAAILEGIHKRHLDGQTVGEGFDGIGDTIHPLLEAGLEATAD